MDPKFSKSSRPRATSPWVSYGIVAMFALAATTMIAMILVALLAPPVVDNIIESYTDTAAVRIAKISEAEKEAVQERVDTFVDAVESDRATPPLTLTAGDLNALVDTHQDDGLSAGNFRIVDDTIVADVSMRLEGGVTLGPVYRDLTGRYINGEAAFRLGFADGMLKVDLVAFRVKGEPVPRWAMRILNRELERAEFWDDPDTQDFLGRLDEVTIERGTIILTPSRTPPPSDEQLPSTDPITESP